MRRETETFDDGHSSVCYYDASDRLTRVETINEKNEIKISVDYIYNDGGLNIERVLRNSKGDVLRRIRFDESGQEIAEQDDGPVRWKSMDGTQEGVDLRGAEKTGGYGGQ